MYIMHIFNIRNIPLSISETKLLSFYFNWCYLGTVNEHCKLKEIRFALSKSVIYL
jgi:hypothetical protein